MPEMVNGDQVLIPVHLPVLAGEGGLLPWPWGLKSLYWRGDAPRELRDGLRASYANPNEREMAKLSAALMPLAAAQKTLVWVLPAPLGTNPRPWSISLFLGSDGAPARRDPAQVRARQLPSTSNHASEIVRFLHNYCFLERIPKGFAQPTPSASAREQGQPAGFAREVIPG